MWHDGLAISLSLQVSLAKAQRADESTQTAWNVSHHVQDCVTLHLLVSKLDQQQAEWVMQFVLVSE
jgi:hypothetical protein